MVLLVSPLHFSLIRYFSNRVTRSNVQTGRHAAEAGSVALQALLAIKTVKTHNAQQHEFQRYSRSIDAHQRAGVEKATFEGLSMGSNWLVVFVSYAVAVLYGCYLVSHQVMNPIKQRPYTGGDVVTVFWSVLVAALTVGDIGPCWADLSSSRVAAHRLFALIDRSPQIDPRDAVGKKRAGDKHGWCGRGRSTSSSGCSSSWRRCSCDGRGRQEWTQRHPRRQRRQYDDMSASCFSCRCCPLLANGHAERRAEGAADGPVEDGDGYKDADDCSSADASLLPRRSQPHSSSSRSSSSSADITGGGTTRSSSQYQDDADDALSSSLSANDRSSSSDSDDPAAARNRAILGHVRFHDVHFAYPCPRMVDEEDGEDGDSDGDDGEEVEEKEGGERDAAGKRNVATTSKTRTPTRKGHTVLRPVLRGITLEARPGQKVALVGPSGHGKSTILTLLQRFYDVGNGRITVDGVDLRSLCLSEWRGAVAVVTQQPTLLLGSVEHNIRCGNDTASAKEVRHAAEEANAHSFIVSLPGGYDSFVGVGGALLSGGQKQRICIARAILRRPRVLLLDEATSALDNENERLVQAALDRLMEKGCAVFVIAHRLSTVANADQICVIEDGKVKERGTHTELMAVKGSRYSLLASTQLQGDRGRGEAGEGNQQMEAAVAPKPTAALQAGDQDDTDDNNADGDDGKKANSMPSEGGGVFGSSSTAGAFDAAEKNNGSEAQKEHRNRRCCRVLRMGSRGGRHGNDNNSHVWWWVAVVLSSVLLGVHFPVWSVCFGKMVAVFYITAGPVIMMQQAVKVALVFVLLGVTFFLAAVVQGRGGGVIGERLSKVLKQRCFGAMLRQESGWFDLFTNNAYNLNHRLNANSGVVQEATIKPIIFVVQSTATLASGVAISFYYGWKLALVGLAAVPFLITLSMLQYRYVTWFAADEMRDFERAGALVSDAMREIRAVQANGVEDAVVAAYASVLASTQRIGLQRAVLSGLCYGAYYAVVCAAYALSFWYAAVLESRGEVLFEHANIIIFAIVVSAIDSGKSLVRILPSLAIASEAQRDLFKCIDRTPLIPEDPLEREEETEDEDAEGGGKRGDEDTAVTPLLSGEHEHTVLTVSKGAGDGGDDEPPKIELRDVRFRYPSRPEQPVLRGLSFSVSSGENVALVGVSGSGKSTILNLLLRLYDPVVRGSSESGGKGAMLGCGGSAGAVLLNGVDVRTMNVHELRRRVGAVAQEPTLFHGTIFDNITYGMKRRRRGNHDKVEGTVVGDNVTNKGDGGSSDKRDDDSGGDGDGGVTLANVKRAAERAGAASFIETLPQKYFTLLGAGGSLLSGGQAQRVAIARALVRDPEVLILDEATSALDNEAEAVVQQTLDEIQASRQYAVVSIAHRLGTVRGADAIHVVHRGRVAERGTHDELMKIPGGRYAGMYNVGGDPPFPEAASGKVETRGE